MKKQEEAAVDTPEKSMALAVGLLHNIICEYKERECTLLIDGVDRSGYVLLLEIMNIPSIGPNLFLNPMADAGDGELEVILIPASQREKFAAYIKDRKNSKDIPYSFSALKGKEIMIKWGGIHLHADDKLLKVEKSTEIKIEIHSGLLEFMVPKPV